MIKSHSSDDIRRCSKCGRPLAQANSGDMCFSCQPRKLRRINEYGQVGHTAASRAEYYREYRARRKAAAI